jgi:beta-galactosidase
MMSAGAQQTIPLNEHWQFIKQDLGGVWEAVRPVIKNNPEAYPLWTDVSLPHCVNAEDAVDPDVNYYQGPAWYRTMLQVNNPYKNGRTFLHFEGAGQKTDVYLYTKLLGSHTGGYDEWSIDITDAVSEFKKTTVFLQQFHGNIPISVRADNSRDQQMIPSSLSDFNIYGGLYRPVELVYEPQLSIEKIFLASNFDKVGKMGKVSMRLKLYNPSSIPSATFRINIFDPQGRPISKWFQTMQIHDADLSLPAINIKTPQSWSPSAPSLYSLEITLVVANDSCKKFEKFGFRNFEFTTKGPFFLNGQRLLLRGTHRHEDHAGVGAAMTREMQRDEMIMIKEMGVNFIRLGHYQQSKYILDLCDSLGILAWEEIPWCRGGVGNEIYQSQAKRMLTNMIEQHFNHPSIIIWGLGNENDWPGDFPIYDSTGVRALMNTLDQLAHALDPTRVTAIRRCDFCRDIVDVYSPSIWAGWYRGVYTDYKNFTQKEFDKVDHFLHVEWGGDSYAGRHAEKPDSFLLQFLKTKDSAAFVNSLKGAKDGDYNEEFTCNLMDWHLKEQETMPWLTGTAQWAFKDFSTPIRPDNPIPYMNQKGVVERDLTKKEAYYVFQSYWANKPMVHIAGHHAPVRWGRADEEKLVKVYSNGSDAELFLDGKSLGLKKRNSQDFPAAGLHWITSFHPGKNTLWVIAHKESITMRDTISFFYQDKKWGKPQKALVENESEKNDIVTMHVKLVDKENQQCLDATNWVRFSLAGDGRLIDNQGTARASRYIQLSNGTATISVKTHGGKSVVCAKVDGVPAVFINL